MSSHDDVIEATVELPGLRVSVSGTPAKVADFVRFAASYGPDRARSPDPSVGSFELLSEASGLPASSRPGLESRDQISASFPPCPVHHLAGSTRLTGASISGRARVLRAWTAGLWAKAVLEGRVPTPNRTPPLDLRSRFYAVARADRVDCPVIYRSSASYWRAIGSLESSDSISQSFPSEAEAKVYLCAAGFSEDTHSVLP